MLRWLIKQNGERVLQHLLQGGQAPDIGVINRIWQDVPVEAEVEDSCAVDHVTGSYNTKDGVFHPFKYCGRCGKKLKED